MKKYLCLIVATAIGFIASAQEPQQQIIINNNAPAPTPPPPDTIIIEKTVPPAPAPEKVIVAEPEKVVVVENDDNDDAAFMLGFRYMPTISTFEVHTSEGTADGTFVLSHGFGGFVGLKTSNHFNLQLEIIYLQIAQKFEQGNHSNEVELSYVNVPLMAVFNTGLSHPVNFNVALGPQFGFNTGSKLTVEDGEEADSLHAVLAVKAADIGIAYGVGLDIGSENLKLAVGFRGVYGLVDISDQSNNITTNDYYVLNRSHIQTYSGYIGVTFIF